jgi:hypothetical protein
MTRCRDRLKLDGGKKEELFTRIDSETYGSSDSGDFISDAGFRHQAFKFEIVIACTKSSKRDRELIKSRSPRCPHMAED